MGRPRHTIALLMLALAAAVPAPAEVPPAKPLAQLATEVMGFLVSDVGEGGIRTNDGDPDGYPVPPYFYHYAARDNNILWSCGAGYPGYCAVSYPAFTASIAIDAFLDLRRFNGDAEMLPRACAFADWILEHRTPAGDHYGNLPYSTQTEGVMGGGWDGPAIMTDKPAMFALRLLRLYDITGDTSYWQGALEIAEVLAATQLTGGPLDDGRWPFRVIPADGTVTQDYTSHLQPAVRLFDALAQRTGNAAYGAARDRAWRWLQDNPSRPGAPSYQRWEAFYEDQTPEMQADKQDHYSAHEMIVELVHRRPAGWRETAVAILDTVSTLYLVEGEGTVYGDYEPVTLEWEGWPEATYASSFQYARTALLLHAALAGDPHQDNQWRARALRMVNVCTHGQNNRGVTADGRMFTTIRDLLYPFNIDSWYEQNFNTVLYALEIMSLEPLLAPAGEHHLLSTDRELTTVAYDRDGWAIAYATAGGAGRETARLAGPPEAVLAAGISLPRLDSPDAPGPGWHWDDLRALLTVRHLTSPVQIATSLLDVPAASTGVVLKPPAPNPFNPRTTISFALPAAAPCRMVVYGADGRLVRVLVDARLEAGTHDIVWDGRDARGRMAAAGTYVLRLLAGDAVAICRTVLVK